jgi:PhzF family phenazine biosynthesis protein
MASLRYRIVNVFTRGTGPLTGNPLCVFESGEGLDDATMQALARQLNLSETTFILPSARASARVRIFTPAYEMPFAGHPTLGTAYVCRALGLAGDEVTLEMKAGVIPVSAVADRFTLRANPPTWRELDLPRGALAGLLGLEQADIAERPLWVRAGTEQLVVPLASPAAVRRARPRTGAFDALPGEDGPGQAYVFAETGPGRLLSRFFFPQGEAILEDPATGSATANLGGWCLATGRALPCAFEIAQGEQAGRPSTLFLRVEADRRVLVSGDVIELGGGTFDLR